MTAWRDEPSSVRPMLASTADAPLDSADLAYEPKYDGIRAIIAIEPAARLHDARVERDRQGAWRERSRVRLWSRLGNEKTSQFPEIVVALGEWARPLDRPLVLDAEVVALDSRGEPTGFQNLQGRIHLKTPQPSQRNPKHLRGSVSLCPVAVIVFDLLREGDEDLRGLPLRERRARLEALFTHASHPCVRITEQTIGDGRGLHARARAHGWEGLVAKRLGAPYKSGRRTPDWRKVKLVRHQTCVVSGWTDPRGSRPFFG